MLAGVLEPNVGLHHAIFGEPQQPICIYLECP